jgi:leucyl-tRNA synthetase
MTTRVRSWYALTMFPYPSGDLHTGHWYAMVPSDVAARYRRMRGYNVLFPMGFDAFGLPAENAAIKRGDRPPGVDLREHRADARPAASHGRQLRLGSRSRHERPRVLQMDAVVVPPVLRKGLAYRAEAAANWCPGCQTVLANEQVVDGRCERSDDIVERRFLTQWFFKITAYAEELLRLRRHRVARAHPRHADELDRPLRRRVRSNSRSTCPAWMSR